MTDQGAGTAALRHNHHAIETPDELAKSGDLSWTEHVVRLLHTGAEIEHSLMVQYLFAAYSLGGDQVPLEYRPMVSRWRNNIIAIAKEEMGHFLTVQNLLKLIGSDVVLRRENFPWDTDYYPFKFALKPFCWDTLCCYLYAEMEPEATVPDRPGKAAPPAFKSAYRELDPDELKEVTGIARKNAPDGQAHSVGALYRQIIDVTSDRTKIPDSSFREHSYSSQASWDDWGRGYKPAPRMLDPGGSIIKPKPGTFPMAALTNPASGRTAFVLIDRAATRTEMVKALRALAAQGEAPSLRVDATGEPSHFDRFSEIFHEYKRLLNDPKYTGWSPSRPVVSNPITQKVVGGRGMTLITNAVALPWARLFNLRYRMLLMYLAHTFRLEHRSGFGSPNLRSMIMHKVFGEMYNIKALAGILVEMPAYGADDPARAAPPFELPYMIGLPTTESDTWQLHHSLLANAGSLIRDIRRVYEKSDVKPGIEYLNSLSALDEKTLVWIDQLMKRLDPSMEFATR